MIVSLAAASLTPLYVVCGYLFLLLVLMCRGMLNGFWWIKCFLKKRINRITLPMIVTNCPG